MTAPRQLCRGASYFVTRRCHDRRFLLKPTKLTNQIIAYVLAWAARRNRVQIHAFCVMSNHLHLVLTDPEATLPRFEQDLDGLLARAINALYGQRGHFWEAGGYHAVVLDGPEELLDRCAYTLANPVAAGLVRRGRKWPGLWSAPERVGTELEFDRPSHFFRHHGMMPKAERLKLAVPPGWSAEAFRERLEGALRAREEKAASGRLGFLGVARVVRQRALDRPGKAEERRQEAKPRFAARNGERLKELEARLEAFLAEYRTALRAWREGRRRVVFPEGTYQLRVEHRVLCAGFG